MLSCVNVFHLILRLGRSIIPPIQLAAAGTAMKLKYFSSLNRLLFGCFLLLVATPAQAASPPNILLVMADDLGFSDLGCYGGEIETPHLDRLAAHGLRFTQFYNTGRCWPTRGSLLTGYYPQQIRRDKVAGVPSGNRGKRPAWAPLLPELLKDAGYRSYHSGKWHLDSMPIATGFDRSFYLADQGRFFSPKRHFVDDVQMPPIDRGTGFYGTTAIADHAIECLRKHLDESPDRPFFQYIAFTAPHFPLHALPEDVAKYSDRYDVGWDKVRADRYAKQKTLGIVTAALSDVERELGPPYDFPDAIEQLGPGEINRPLSWQSLTPQQQAFQATKMSLHAAMIDRLDQELGRVIKQLNESGQLENTLIFFLSDNGASAEIMVRDDGHDPSAAPGSADSYLCLGPGWSTVSNTPLRRHKTWVHEGGIATPLIVHWPAGVSDKGKLRRTPGHVIDITATVLQAAGIEQPATDDQPNKPDRPGKSLLPAFDSDIVIDRDWLWWSHEGNRALRKQDWKVVQSNDHDYWELYNLKEDRTERTNLAREYPEKLRQLVELWHSTDKEFQKHAKSDL
ncbi:MAG: arylsulfatase [Pirellulaceae bacterium]